MTPFDPVALVAMLATFYPSVTRTSIERAFRERPEYFAGGRLGGRLLDALFLPDGRIFDIVFAAWTSQSRWQALDVTHAGPKPDDPFALDEGPLVEVDVDAALPPRGDPGFVSLVGAQLGELAPLADLLGGAATTIADGADVGALDTALDVGSARDAHEQSRRALEGQTPADLVDATGGLGGQIDGHAGEYVDPDEAVPPDIPPDDPGDPPADEPPDTRPPEV